MFVQILAVAALLGSSACTVNPATGQNQFTALMTPQQEQSIGIEEHQKVLKTFGLPDDSRELQAYVDRIGQSLAVHTERPDVRYTFTVLDTPTINAFAIPGGYIYVTRGLLALANDEAELAAVLAHEIGHITGRHSAERYSRSIVTALGTAALAAALDSQGASQVLDLGAELYTKSYSRSQESESDHLGVRYLHKAGYDTFAMARFLESMGRAAALESRIKGQPEPFSYFSTHPQTDQRVAESVAEAGRYAKNQGTVNAEAYLRQIDGMIFGDSPRHGFVRDGAFWHPAMDFTFTIPRGFTVENLPEKLVGSSRASGAAFVFDAAALPSGATPATYISQVWLKGQMPEARPEDIVVNGRPGASAGFNGQVNGRPSHIRLIAIQGRDNMLYRFQIAIPLSAGESVLESLKAMTYSLRHLSASEKQSIHPQKLRIVRAGQGETAQTMARRMELEEAPLEWFAVLNALPSPSAPLKAGAGYKIVGR